MRFGLRLLAVFRWWGFRSKPMVTFRKVEATEVRRVCRDMEGLLWRLRSRMVTPWPGDVERVEAELARQRERLKALLEPEEKAG
jgi:hypothetical protein